MRLHEQGLAVIEVGVNETASKERNRNVPYGPEEVAASVIDAARAGAAIVHFHARGDDGSQAWTDVDVYARAMDLIAGECDVLCYPTYPPRVPRAQRYAHVWALATRAGPGRLELAPLDIGSRNVVLWDAATRTFATLDLLPPEHQVAINPPDELEWVLAEARRLGLHPTLGIFDLTYIRYSVHARWAGLLDEPLLLKWFLAQRWASGPFPTVAGLDAYVDQVPADVDHEGIVVPYAMTDRDACEALWQHALERGQGIRVGIGDCPDIFPTETNATLVSHAADLLSARGLAPASPSDVRRRLGIEVRGRRQR